MLRKRVKSLKEETNSTIYRRIRNSIFSGCPMCSPHKGCNKWKSGFEKNWKKYRKNQWKD